MDKKRKLLPILSALLIIGFIVTSFVSFFVSQASLRDEIVTNALPLTSDNIYSEIQRDLLRPIFISSLMANDTFLRDWVLNGENEEAQITKYLNEIMIKYNTITSFFVSDNTLNYYHASGFLKQISPDSVRDVWYYRVRDMQNPYEINVDVDLANQDVMTIFINYRVTDFNGEYIGATGVGLTVNNVKNIIQNYQDKYGRYIYFFDQRGEIKLASSEIINANVDPRKILGSSFFGNEENKLVEKAFKYIRDKQTFHANIRFIEELGWYLIVEQSDVKVTRKVYASLILNLLVCAVITIVVLFLVNIAIKRYQTKIDTLKGIVPICSFCKQVRDDKGYWNQVEAYFAEHTDAEFSHGICPSCMEKHYPGYHKPENK